MVEVIMLASSVTLDQSTIDLFINLNGPGVSVLTPTVNPVNVCNPDNLTWTSSNESVAIVDAYGVVTALSPGVTQITVTIDGVSATSIVTVVNVAKEIQLNHLGATLNIRGANHDQLLLNATITPLDADDQRVEWFSEDETIAVVDQNGNVTAVGPGTTRVFARAVDWRATGFDGIFDHADDFYGDVYDYRVHAYSVITVNMLADQILLDRWNVDLIIDGETHESAQIIAVVLPSNTTDQRVQWSGSNALVATVSSDGTVTATGPGTAQITATSMCGEISATATVNVTSLVTNISLNPQNFTLNIQGGNRDQLRLNPTITPSNASDQRLIWSSLDEHVALVDSNGTVVANNPGTTTIVATSFDGRITTNAAVTVRMLPSNITLNENFVTLTINGNQREQRQIFATVWPYNVCDPTVTWSSSNPAVATVDNNGIIRSIGPGTAIITARSGNITATSEVTVISRVTGMTLNRSSATLNIRENSRGTVDLTPIFDPSNATDQRVTWTSSNPTIATVDGRGRVTAGAPGTTTITATSVDGNFTATANITVRLMVDSVTLYPATYTIDVGGSVRLNVEVLPVNANDRSVRWETSNRNIATVDANGVVRGVAGGTVTISAISNCGNITATSRITVLQQPTSVTLPRTWINLGRNQTYQLTPTVLPTNAWNRSVTYRSSDPNIVRVYPDGRITAVGNPGQTAAITATTTNGLTFTIAVTVAIPVQSVLVSPPSKDLIIGQSYRFISTVYPFNADNQVVRWESSNPSVASVEHSGLVTAHSAGTAEIRVVSECGGRVATSTVRVINPVPPPAPPVTQSPPGTAGRPPMPPRVYPWDFIGPIRWCCSREPAPLIPTRLPTHPIAVSAGFTYAHLHDAVNDMTAQDSAFLRNFYGLREVQAILCESPAMRPTGLPDVDFEDLMWIWLLIREYGFNNDTRGILREDGHSPAAIRTLWDFAAGRPASAMLPERPPQTAYEYFNNSKLQSDLEKTAERLIKILIDYLFNNPFRP